MFTPPNDGGSAITGYTADCASSDGGTENTNTDVASPITVTGLSNGHTYTCAVTATNTNGNSLPSTTSASVVPNAVADQPAAPTVLSGNRSMRVTFAMPNDSGSPITAYTASCTSANGGVSGQAAGPASPQTVGGLSNGHAYTCTVTATNAAGNSLSSPSSAAGAPSTVPAAPTHPRSSRATPRSPCHFTQTAPSARRSRRTESRALRATSARRVRSPLPVHRRRLRASGYSYTCVVDATNTRGSAPPSSSAAVP